MDPAFLNYLQQQQSNQTPNGGQTPAPQNQAYNPFDIGISKALASARESLGMTEKQQDKALRNSMLTFADNIAQQPKQKGFWNNFGSVGRALSPAIMAHDDAEEAAITQNNALANQILAYQAAEQQKQVQAEEQAWRRQHAEAQLGEQKRYHNLMDDFRKGNNPAALPLTNNFIPIESKAERLMYSKDKKSSGEILKELSSIKKDYEDFRKISQKDVIDPMTPYGIGKTANATKDFFGYFTGNKELRGETSKRKALDAKLGKFAVELERKIKGGVLSEGMVKRFENKGLLPSLSDAPDVFEEKLGNLMKEMQERQDASTASLKYGVHISPYDLEQLEGRGQEEANAEAPQAMIKMMSPDGEQINIPADDAQAIQDALNDGFNEV